MTHEAGDKNKWIYATGVYLDAIRAGSRVNTRNVQYCLIQMLASLKTGVDEDFNEASVLADVKRHVLRRK